MHPRPLQSKRDQCTEQVSRSTNENLLHVFFGHVAPRDVVAVLDVQVLEHETQRTNYFANEEQFAIFAS